MNSDTRHLNTDLEIVATSDLTPLVQACESLGLFLVHLVQRESGDWFANFETTVDLGTPEASLGAILDVIESLDGDAQALWSACSSRCLNIGYQCGDTPFSTGSEVSNDTLSRLAKTGAALRITMYGAGTT